MHVKPTASRNAPARAARDGFERRRRRVRGGGVAERAALIHRDDHPAGRQVPAALGRHGLSWTVVRSHDGEPLPDVESLRVAILSGAGPTGAAHVEWLRDADRAGVAVLALGTAAHDLAAALGGWVSPGPRPRRGWINVKTSQPGLVAAGPWLTWDGKRIGLPSGAREIARDHTGPQAFASGHHIGIQLHPCAAAETVRDWSSRSDVVIDYQGLLEAASRDGRASHTAADRLVDGFLASVLNPAH